MGGQEVKVKVMRFWRPGGGINLDPFGRVGFLVHLVRPTTSYVIFAFEVLIKYFLDHYW